VRNLKKINSTSKKEITRKEVVQDISDVFRRKNEIDYGAG
jgi:hypothetical protein